MISTSHRLFLCPEWIAQAVMGRADPVERLFSAEYMNQRFSMHDLAFNEALQDHPAVKRLFGDFFKGLPASATEEAAIQSVRAWSIVNSDTLRQEIDDALMQDASNQDKQEGLFKIYHAIGVTVIAIKPGFIRACENDNYLIGVFREVTRHAMRSEGLPSLLGGSDLVRRFLQMAAILSPKRPPKPVFV